MLRSYSNWKYLCVTCCTLYQRTSRSFFYPFLTAKTTSCTKETGRTLDFVKYCQSGQQALLMDWSDRHGKYFFILPGSFWVTKGKCFNAAEAKQSHGGCVCGRGCEKCSVGFPSVWLFAGLDGIKAGWWSSCLVAWGAVFGRTLTLHGIPTWQCSRWLNSTWVSMLQWLAWVLGKEDPKSKALSTGTTSVVTVPSVSHAGV